MRPSLSEQLTGVSRILREVIGPELSDPYPLDILNGVCATLDALSEGWEQLPGFLDWDARRSAEITEAALTAGSPLPGPIDDEAHERLTRLAEPQRPWDIAELQRRQRIAREALAAVIPAIAEKAELASVRADVDAHMRERAAAYPLKPAWRPAASLQADNERQD